MFNLPAKDEVASGMLGYCKSCGDSGATMMTAEAVASLSSAIFVPSNLNEIIREEGMSKGLFEKAEEARARALGVALHGVVPLAQTLESGARAQAHPGLGSLHYGSVS